MDLQTAVNLYLSSQTQFLERDYNWDFSLNGFPDVNYQKCGSNDYARSRHLRNYIHEKINSESSESFDYQNWYVKYWGGVRTNKPETIQIYIKSDYQSLLSLEKKGVATWSKILSIRDPKSYAIYDARVALAINSIQKKYSVSNPVLFPQLNSRNNSFVLPTQHKIKNSKYFSDAMNLDFYSRYLELLSGYANSQNNFDIQDAEMVFFSGAKQLSQVWF